MDSKDFSGYIGKLLDQYLNSSLISGIRGNAKQTGMHVTDQEVRQNFRQHLESVLFACTLTKTLVRNSDVVDFEKIYVPLTVTTNKGETKVDRFPKLIFGDYYLSIIKDTAGMGKTTLLKYIAIKIIEECRGLPVKFELRNIDAENPLMEQLLSTLNQPIQLFDKSTVRTLAHEPFIVLFDGYDEVPDRDKKFVKKAINDFRGQFPGWHYVITTRQDLNDESFLRFVRSSIKPLSLIEAKQQIRLYDNVYKRGITDALIEKINNKLLEEHIGSFHYFLENPFMVSLLYKIYSPHKDLPTTKDEFFSQVYNALFYEHDELKGMKRERKSGLGFTDFTSILEKFSFDTLEQFKTEYTLKEMIEFIESAANYVLKDRAIDPNDFKEDLEITVPLILREELKYRWWQKSFQDYFAARFVKKQPNKRSTLEEIYKDQQSGYMNLLDIYYDIDRKSFTQTILKLLLTDFLTRYEELKRQMPKIQASDIDLRRNLLAFHDFVYVYNTKRLRSGHAIDFIREKEGKALRDPIEVKASNDISIIYQSNFRLDLVRQIGRRRQESFLRASHSRLNPDLELHPLTTTLQEQPIYIYKLDDDTSAWYNQAQNFSIVNEILSLPQANPYIFDVDRTKTFLTEIV